MQKRRRENKGREVTGPGIEAPKTPDLMYRRQLNKLVRDMAQDTANAIAPIIREYDRQFSADGISTDLRAAFNRLLSKYTELTATAAPGVADTFVRSVARANKRKFDSMIKKTIGVDLPQIIEAENLEPEIRGAVQENVSLITSIPAEYFPNLEKDIFEIIVSGENQGNLIDAVEEVFRKDNKKWGFNRSKLIARDQTSKINGDLNQARQTKLGIEEYIWRTSGDERVREDHRENNGKVFRWDDPPPTGHPGEDIQCRCVAQAIIKL